MFSMRLFVKGGFLAAVGKMADYQIILNAAGWAEKNVLTEDDLAEIQAAIDAHNAPAPEPENLPAPEQEDAPADEDAEPDAEAEEGAEEG